MRSIAAQLAFLALSCAVLATSGSGVQAEAGLEDIYAKYAPMFRYWCLSAEQRYASERRTHTAAVAGHDRTEACERLAAIYENRLKTLVLADGEANHERVTQSSSSAKPASTCR